MLKDDDKGGTLIKNLIKQLLPMQVILFSLCFRVRGHYQLK
jgi:hypothetical protein